MRTIRTRCALAARPLADAGLSTAGKNSPIKTANAPPERVVHAKGSGAYGTLTITHDIRQYSKAAIFSEIGKKTDVFLRFSTVAGESGAADAENYHVNPFDLTKVWPHADYPLIDVGILELNRNPENYFTEVEESSFSPSNIVPGISFSSDKILQARIFSYADAHRYRVGTHC